MKKAWQKQRTQIVKFVVEVFPKDRNTKTRNAFAQFRNITI